MPLRSRQKLGKYRIEKRLGQGGFAVVYKAYDTVEGVYVALKLPRSEHVSKQMLEDFRREARVAAKLDHPNILHIKTAEMVEGRFVIVYPLGAKTLDDRIRTRMSFRTAFRFAEQMLEALAFAHNHNIIHCDLKPENLILFADDRLRLADFGIAKVALKTIPMASGAGTVGYMAPEQAMGKPSFRSDVFSAGLILWRMFTGVLPEWPFQWPPAGFDKVRRKLHPEFLELMRRCMHVDHRKRFADGAQLLAAFKRIKPRALGFYTARSRKKKQNDSSTTRDWRRLRTRQFLREHGNELEARLHCPGCHGPVAEAMTGCPWCGRRLATLRQPTRMPRRCTRCGRGMKADWRFCAHCYGPGFQVRNGRSYDDKRYAGRCSSPDCERKVLLPFSRYCPWCRTKVRKRWKIAGSKHLCSHCGWGVVPEYWRHCPWCCKALKRR